MLLSDHRTMNGRAAVNWDQLFSVPTIIFLVPIVAIVGGVATGIAKMYFRHQERLEMIARGIHPDYPPEEETDDGGPGRRGAE